VPKSARIVPDNNLDGWTYALCMDDAVVADRLTLVSQVTPGGGGAKFLDKPVMISPGQRYWYNDEKSALFVEDATGGIVSYPCAYGSGPDAPR
jgi:hypothetical protein